MTIESVLTASIALIQTGLPGTFTSVVDARGYQEESFPDDQLPGVMLIDRPNSVRERVAGMDCKFQDWVLDCHVFAVYNPTDGGDAGRAAFEALVESVRALFRANRTLPAGDSLPTTQLLAIGAGAAVATDPWVDDSGMVLRHTRVGLDVHEVIYE